MAGDATLLDVAVAVAADDQEAVRAWLEAGALRRPRSEELARWDEAPVSFESVIVQPFVLCRPLPNDAPPEDG